MYVIMYLRNVAYVPNGIFERDFMLNLGTDNIIT